MIARRTRDPAAFRAAIELYAGELLPEDRYEEWAEARREELRQLYLMLLMELAGLYEARDEYGLAIEALRKAMAKEPTLEEAHVGLMRLYALSGRPERALAQYERLHDVLSKGSVREPAATTRRLRDDIATGSSCRRHLPLFRRRIPRSRQAQPARLEDKLCRARARDGSRSRGRSL